MKSVHANNTMPLDEDAMWRAVVQKDQSAEGAFFYSVRSTGVYCRPSCAARLARRENVAFHASCDAAESAGFRSCKRCKPREAPLVDRHAALVAEACRAIEASGVNLKLEELAASAGMSAFHFHRVFTSIVGVTPKRFAQARRAKRAREALGEGQTITTAIYDAGFSSSGRFYASSNSMLGMTPSNFRQGAQGLSIQYAVGQCSLGWVVVAATEKGICAILFGDDRESALAGLHQQFPRADLRDGDAGFVDTVAKVIDFIDAPSRPVELPLSIQGTAFQVRVWDALREIPPGETVSYSQLAERIGAPRATRAVARACAANKIAVVIPCHRVVKSGGESGGYRWGAQRKEELLRKERAVAPKAGPAPISSRRMRAAAK